MNKFRLFVENFLIYGIGGIISKIIPLIMVPIVIRLMPCSNYYGLSDLSNTIVSFAGAFAVMGMYDAMYRLFFEDSNEEYKKSVCSTTFIFTLSTSIVVFFIMMMFRNPIAQYVFGDKNYQYIVYLSAIATLVGATNTIISAPTRMQNKKKIFLVTNTLSPLLSYSVSIPILLKGHYTIALPLAAVISGSIMEISFGIMNKKWFIIRKFDLYILKQLLIIAIPLLPNFLIYWIFNSCDKIMITNMIGIGAAGIYSVGSKLGHMSQLIYTAFTGGWQFFAFSTMKERNQVETNSLIFEYLGIISFSAASFVCAWSYFIFRLLFTEEYLEGYIVAPYLFLAPLLQMLFQIASNQFLVIKKTWPNILILMFGAVLNILINFNLIPILGIEGASIATLMGYIAADIVCVIVLSKMNLMTVSNRFILSAAVMAGYIVLWRLFFSSKIITGTLGAVIVTIIYLIIYRADLIKVLKMTKGWKL